MSLIREIFQNTLKITPFFPDFFPQVLGEHQFIVLPDAAPPGANGGGNNGGGGDDTPNQASLAGSSAPIKLSEACKREFQLTEETIRSQGESLQSVLRRVS